MVYEGLQGRVGGKKMREQTRLPRLLLSLHFMLVYFYFSTGISGASVFVTSVSVLPSSVVMFSSESLMRIL